MKQTQFHIEKKLLKSKIAVQEQILKYEIERTLTPKKIILKIIPSSIKKMLGLTDSSTNNTAPTIANLIVKIQNTIGSFSQIVTMVKQFRSQMNDKK
ncbi:MAG: hypothetical protein P1U44_13780 [Vicingaceae bacterium]|mgnify:CR=1 FL=1|jgi:signal recognition particle GTPase|nr:hypothetical protein [Flavobacteriales bacterium]MBQ20858.1 hypothetical protein [Flavobacteriales bacterium]MDF1676781.1 hypothetical protein [Vicingaceae bacterium]|tara:strand:+ start:42 stop:332 length:291 start_codon:yes stop_codon:yes gene_type:complete